MKLVGYLHLYFSNSYLHTMLLAVSCEERCLEDDDPINSVCRCDASCSQYNNCCDDYDDVCGVGEGKQNNLINDLCKETGTKS